MNRQIQRYSDIFHLEEKGLKKPEILGFPSSGASPAPRDGNPLFMSAETGQGAGSRLQVYYFRKRVNDFTILGKASQRFYYLGLVETMSLLISNQGNLRKVCLVTQHD